MGTTIIDGTLDRQPRLKMVAPKGKDIVFSRLTFQRADGSSEEVVNKVVATDGMAEELFQLAHEGRFLSFSNRWG